MYIHYAKIDLPTGKFVQLLFSDSFTGKWNSTLNRNEFFVSKKNFSNVVTPLVAIIKQIPSTDRAFDANLKIWIIPPAQFDNLIKIAKAFMCEPREWTNLYTELINRNNTKEWKAVPDAQEFFYEQPASQQGQLQSSNELTLPQIELKLREYLQIPNEIQFSTVQNDLKKIYRRAALRLHPDVNGGDSSKMSDLNFYYQEYERLSK